MFKTSWEAEDEDNAMQMKLGAFQAPCGWRELVTPEHEIEGFRSSPLVDDVWRPRRIFVTVFDSTEFLDPPRLSFYFCV